MNSLKKRRWTKKTENNIFIDTEQITEEKTSLEILMRKTEAKIEREKRKREEEKIEKKITKCHGNIVEKNISVLKEEEIINAKEFSEDIEGGQIYAEQFPKMGKSDDKRLGSLKKVEHTNSNQESNGLNGKVENERERKISEEKSQLEKLISIVQEKIEAKRKGSKENAKNTS